MTKNENTLPVSAAYESGSSIIIGFLAGVTGPNEFYERSYELAPNASAAEGETGRRLREQYRTITVGGFLGDGYGIEGKQVDLELYVSLSGNRDSLSDLVLS